MIVGQVHIIVTIHRTATTIHHMEEHITMHIQIQVAVILLHKITGVYGIVVAKAKVPFRWVFYPNWKTTASISLLK